MFVVLAALYVAPLWAFPYVATADGPYHLANAIIVKNYGDPVAAVGEPVGESRGTPIYDAPDGFRSPRQADGRLPAPAARAGKRRLVMIQK